jgi:hypothetical protein
MKTSDFTKKITSSQLKENISKMFGMQVTLEKYSREQLEDMRNKLRTRLFQHEGQAGINDLLTNETYQKDKAMLDLLNTRIKEMLGEDIKKLKDKMVELSEAKKGVRAPKFTKKAKGTKDYDGDGKVEPAKDEVWGSRAKAAAKAGKPFEESAKPDFLDLDKDGNKKEPMKSASKEKKMKEGFDDMDKDVADRAASDKKKQGTGKFDTKKTEKGTQYTRKASTFTDGGVDKDVKKAQKESADKCNHTLAGKKCPVHGLKECGTMEAKEKPSAGMSKAEKSSVVKKAKAGGDIGKPGKSFEKVAKAAGGGEKGKKIAAAAMWKQQAKESQATYRRNVKIVNESLSYLIQEDEEEKAKAITAAGDMANDFTSWMQRVGQYQTKVMIELSDEIRHNFGAAEAEAFKQSVSPALAATLEVLTQQREVLSNAIAALAGGQPPVEPMGTEPSMDPAMPPEEPMEPVGPDELNPGPADEFAASDAAAGAGTPGREMRESKFARKLAESHSIMSKLAR